MALELVDIVGLAIGVPSIFIALIAVYYIFVATRIVSGGLKAAFTKAAIGILLILFSASWQGITMGALNIYDVIWVAVIGSGSSLLGSIFLLIGFRALIKMFQEARA